MPSVYIETTIPSYYHSTRRSIQSLAWRAQTRRWWDSHRASFNLRTSQAVVLELMAAPSPRAAARLRLIEDVPRLALAPEIDRIAAEYIRQRLMPAAPGGDAVHVAAASFYALDYLLTWNCQHIANASKAMHLAVINRRLGLHVPMMVTPYNLIPDDET